MTSGEGAWVFLDMPGADPFARATMERMVTSLRAAGFLINRFPRFSDRIQYRTTTEGPDIESDLDGFLGHVSEDRGLHTVLQSEASNVSALLHAHVYERRPFVHLSMDDVYFVESNGESSRTPRDSTQSLLRLCSALSTAFRPERIFGGSHVQTERLRKQAAETGHFREIPWLFDVRLEVLPPDLRITVERELFSLTTNLYDSRTLIALSDKPVVIPASLAVDFEVALGIRPVFARSLYDALVAYFDGRITEDPEVFLVDELGVSATVVKQAAALFRENGGGEYSIGVLLRVEWERMARQLASDPQAIERGRSPGGVSELARALADRFRLESTETRAKS